MFLVDESVKYTIQKMKKEMKNILIVEFNWFHDEVVIPLLELLNEEYNCSIIANKKWIEKDTWSLFSKSKISSDVFYTKKIYRKYFYSIDNFRRIIKTINILLSKKINIIIFNTLDIYNDDIVLLIKMIKLFRLPTKIIGIIHNAEKIDKYKKLVDQIFVLSPIILQKKSLSSLSDNVYNVDFFYPILYKFKDNLVRYSNPEFIITIPGNIEYSRRDYRFLYDFVLEKIVFLEKNNIKFIILGNYKKNLDGEIFYNLIMGAGLEKYFKFFDYTISYREYMNIISNSQLIMPLIHPNIKNFKNYLKNKISASFNMSFSTNIPLIMHSEFKKLDEFNQFSFFYNSNNSLEYQLKILLKNKMKLFDASLNIKNSYKFSKCFQIQKICNIIKNM